MFSPGTHISLFSLFSLFSGVPNWWSGFSCRGFIWPVLQQLPYLSVVGGLPLTAGQQFVSSFKALNWWLLSHSSPESARVSAGTQAPCRFGLKPGPQLVSRQLSFLSMVPVFLANHDNNVPSVSSVPLADSGILILLCALIVSSGVVDGASQLPQMRSAIRHVKHSCDAIALSISFLHCSAHMSCTQLESADLVQAIEMAMLPVSVVMAVLTILLVGIDVA